MQTASPEALANVSRYYYIDGLSEKEILSNYGPHLGVKNQTAVSRLLREARLLGVVSFVIDRAAALRGDVNNALSTDLYRNFGLRRARVYDLPATLSDSSLHIALANHAADDPKTPIRISDGDHVGIAGGRAVCSFAQALARSRQEPIKNVTVSPLGGSLWLGRMWKVGEGRELERPLNADYAAILMAMALNSGNSQGIQFSQVSHELHCSSVSMASEVMKAQCPFLPGGSWNWALPPPNQAICGVGVLDAGTGHRLIQFLSKAQGREGGPLFRRLRSAVSLCTGHALPYLGDVANRLFAAVPLPSAEMDLDGLEHAYRKLLPELRTLNEHSVVIQWRHLRSIVAAHNGQVHLIAGGDAKVQVLWTTLLAGYFSEKRRLVSSIYTDSGTARILLAELRKLEEGPGRLKSWYQRMVERIFAP